MPRSLDQEETKNQRQIQGFSQENERVENCQNEQEGQGEKNITLNGIENVTDQVGENLPLLLC